MRVWTKKPKESYKYKYSWLPQPMLGQAALAVYKDNRERKERGAPLPGEQGEDERVAVSSWRDELGERSVMSNISNSLASIMSIVSPEKKKKSTRRSPSPKSRAKPGQSPGKDSIIGDSSSVLTGGDSVKSKPKSKKKLHPEAFH